MNASQRGRHALSAVLIVGLLLVGPPAWLLLAALGAAMAVESVLLVRALRAWWLEGRDGRCDAGRLRLGSDPAGRPVTLGIEQLSAHALILGASGAGKSTTLLTITCDHIARGRPAVVVDLKGSPSFAGALADAAAAAGRSFRLWTPDGPSYWNPLAHGNATELKDKLIGTERFTEPHYKRAAERYLQTTLQLLIAARPERPPELADVVALTDSRRLAALLRQAPPALAERVRDYLRGLTPDQVSAIQGIGTRLAIITESHAGAFLADAPPGAPKLDLRGALAGGEVVLFSLNSSRYGSLAAQLGTLAVQDLVTAVGDRLAAGGGPPALIAIDEFSALGADHLIALLARGREAGAAVVLATQELADLDRAARGLRDQVLGNTAVKIAHRQDVPASARTIAEMAGTVRVWEDGTRLRPAASLLGRRAAPSNTARLVERHVVEPNEISRLATGQAVLITKLPVPATRRVQIAPPPAPPARRHESERGGLER